MRVAIDTECIGIEAIQSKANQNFIETLVFCGLQGLWLELVGCEKQGVCEVLSARESDLIGM